MWPVGSTSYLAMKNKHKKHGCHAIPEIISHKPESIQIDGCNCALVDSRENGQLVYSYDLLLEHFKNHELMFDEEDEESYDTASEWVDYNVIRGIEYINSPLRPDILDYEGKSIFGDEVE